MAYIDPDGMFGGDRMALLSDSAKFAWPWFWCASNTVGRVELHYQLFLDTAFRRFKKQPPESLFWEWVAEFHESHLLFVYEVEGQVWGQWSVSEKYLPDYKREKDKRTPAPPAESFAQWQDEYLTGKKSRLVGKCRVLNVSRNFEKFSEVLKTSGSFPLGEERKGEDKTPTTASAVDVLDTVAQQIWERHPQARRCSLSVVKARLKAIVKGVSDRDAKLSAINECHAGWCATRDWRKEGGTYAKGLENWLAPTMGRFDVPPPQADGQQGLFGPPPKTEYFDISTITGGRS